MRIAGFFAVLGFLFLLKKNFKLLFICISFGIFVFWMIYFISDINYIQETFKQTSSEYIQHRA